MKNITQRQAERVLEELGAIKIKEPHGYLFHTHEIETKFGMYRCHVDVCDRIDTIFGRFEEPNEVSGINSKYNLHRFRKDGGFDEEIRKHIRPLLT